MMVIDEASISAASVVPAGGKVGTFKVSASMTIGAGMPPSTIAWDIHCTS